MIGVEPASQMRPWSERKSEAAHRTSPGKDAGGTEINLLPYEKAFFLLVTLSFLQNEMAASFIRGSHLLLFHGIDEFNIILTYISRFSV